MSDLAEKTAIWWELNQATRGRNNSKPPTVQIALDKLNDILDSTGSHRKLAQQAETMKSSIVVGPKKESGKP